jgi:hypothetical protein
MTRPRWKLSDLLLLVLACAIAFAAYSYFWQPGTWNTGLYLSAYLALLSPATLGSFFARPGWRRPFQGFALFGWCNLVIVLLRVGFQPTMISSPLEWIEEGAQMGLVFGVLAALLAGWLLEPPSARQGNT